MLELILTYYRYNAWAMERTLEACSQLSEEEYTTAYCSGNGTIAETISHLITVQWGWVSWFEGSMEMREAVGIMTKNKLATLSEARAKWGEVNQQTNDFLSKQTDESLVAIRSFTRMNGKQESHPFWKLMMHTANHGTHTRAQIAAAIRRLEKNPGNVDLLNYVLNFGG